MGWSPASALPAHAEFEWELEGNIEAELRLFPNDVASPGYLMEAGRAYEQAGEYDDAVEVYKTVTDDYPQSPQARNVELLVARAEARQMASS